MRPFRKGDRVNSVTGDAWKVLYSPIVHDDGVIELVESGKQNCYEEIQSHKDSVDIHVLLAQYRNGDTDVLTQRQGVYEDIVGMPKSYAEMFQKIKDGEKAFYQLPVEVRDKFDQSFEKWLIQSGSQDWYEKMTLDPPLVEEIKEEVKTEE